MKWQDHNPEVEVLVRNSDRWINVVSHLAKSLKTDGRCWNLEGHATPLNHIRNCGKLKNHFPKWKKEDESQLKEIR